MKKRVLIVDDEDHICSVLGDYLEDCGYEPLRAGTLAAAKDFLKPDRLPDIILLDVSLPDGNGLDFLKALKNFHGTKAIPVIMMSAHRTEPKSRVQGLEDGAEDYLNKPFDLKEMKLRMGKLLDRKASQASSAPKIAEQASANIQPPSSNVEEALSTALNHVLKKEKVSESAFPSHPSNVYEPVQEIVLPEVRNPIGVFLKRIGKLLVEPRVFFEAWRSHQEINSSLSIMALCAICFGLQIGFQDQSFAGCFIGSLALFVGFIGGTAGVAWIIQWILGLQQKPIKFKTLWAVLGIGFAPLALAGLMGVIYVGISGGHVAEFTAGPLMLLPMQGTSKYWGFVLRRIDIFEMWAVALMALGISRTVKVKFKKSLFWTFCTWALVIALSTAAIGFFK